MLLIKQTATAVALTLSALAFISSASPTRASSRELAGDPKVLYGDFEEGSLRPPWHDYSFAVPVTLTTQPGNRSNHVMRIGQRSCESEKYADVVGHMINVYTDGNYTLRFQYMFNKDTDGVRFDLGVFGCDGCVENLLTDVQYARRAERRKWYTYTGNFVGPKGAGNGKTALDFEPNSCVGPTYLDNFVVTKA